MFPGFTDTKLTVNTSSDRPLSTPLPLAPQIYEYAYTRAINCG